MHAANPSAILGRSTNTMVTKAFKDNTKPTIDEQREIGYDEDGPCNPCPYGAHDGPCGNYWRRMTRLGYYHPTLNKWNYKAIQEREIREDAALYMPREGILATARLLR